MSGPEIDRGPDPERAIGDATADSDPAASSVAALQAEGGQPDVATGEPPPNQDE